MAARTGCAALQKACPSTNGQAKTESTTAPHIQCIAHRGACGKTRDVPHNCRPKVKPTERGVANAFDVVDIWIARGLRTDGGTRGVLEGRGM
jgi:hypothetical protein